MPDESAVWYDITWTAVLDREPTAREQLIFTTVREARDAAIRTVQQAFAAGTPIAGWQADDAARNVIRAAGFADAFTHRTGHNIATSLHGNGAHLDNLETHDVRLILPNTCFSVEPGLYFPGEFGVRNEVDMIAYTRPSRRYRPCANRAPTPLNPVSSKANMATTNATATPAPTTGPIVTPLPRTGVNPILCLVAGWLVPGAGHFLLRKPIRGLLLFASILGMFAVGIALGGKLYSPNTGDLLDILGFAGQVGAGLLYALGRIMDWGTAPILTAVADYGTKFIVVAGLLNIVSAIDAHSLASGRKAL